MQVLSFPGSAETFEVACALQYAIRIHTVVLLLDSQVDTFFQKKFQLNRTFLLITGKQLQENLPCFQTILLFDISFSSLPFVLIFSPVESCKSTSILNNYTNKYTQNS